MRKLLLAVLLVSLTGSAFGAGTFASFNATTSNAGATFATGTLVLSNKVNSGTACFSTGGGTNTDTNVNTGCSALFSTTASKPGDTATVDLDLEDVGTINATNLFAYATAACVGAENDLDANIYTGTGDLCQQTQMTIQQYSSAANRTSGTTTGGRCWFGAGGNGTVTSSSNITFPLTITNSSNDRVGINLNGAGSQDVDFSAGATYTTPFTLAAAIQTAARALGGSYAKVMVGGAWVTTGSTGTISISNGVPGSSASIAIATPTANSGLTQLGLTNGQSSTGSDTTACSASAAHNVASYTSGYTAPAVATAVDLGSVNAAAIRYLRITLSIPQTAGNDIQGRKATFGLTWRLDQ